MDKNSLFRFILVGFAFYLVMPFVAKGLVALMRTPKEVRPISEVFLVFANVIFMGYPVAASIYGDGAIFYLCLFHLLFNLMFFTYGIRNIKKGTDVADERLTIKNILNNGTIASLITLVLFFTDIQLPQVAVNIMSFLGNIATPVSMISIGASIGMYSLKSLFEDKRIFVITIFRLVVIPIAVFGVMTLLGFDGVLRGVATISLGMPVGSMISMSSTQYDSHAKLASSVVVFSTLCSLVTIPIMLVLLKSC
jgi:hypothetical protein